MSAGNVFRVLDAWPDLPPVARLVLVTMAASTSDNESDDLDAGHYFGRAEFLQQKVWGRVDESSARQLKKALTTLRRRGAIRPRVRGGNGRHAEYDLVLSRTRLGDQNSPPTPPHQGEQLGDQKSPPTPTTPPELGDQNGPPQGDQMGSVGGPNGVSWGTKTVPPKGSKGVRDRKETTHPPAPQDRAREDVAADPDHSPAPTSTTPTEPLSPTQMGEYETCSAALRARLGELQAVEAAMKYSDENGCTITDAVIALAKVPA